MPIPALSGGLLPPGIHVCDLEEVEQAFRTNGYRRALFADFRRFLRREYAALSPVTLLLDGSFVTDKPNPSDIDVVADCCGHDSIFPQALALRLLRHPELKKSYRVDFHARHPSLPQDLGAYFQYVGEKSAHRLNLLPKDPKGILRVQP